MKCKFCGNEVEKDMKFCPVCGTEVTQENENTDSEQSGGLSEEPVKQPEYGSAGYEQGGDGQPDNNQGGYGYGWSDGGQGNYGPGNNPYNQPNYEESGNGYGQPNYGQPVKPISSTPYLVFSILATICCCLPLGIAAIVYASKINSLQSIGDYEGARDAAKKARIFSISSAVIGVIASIVMGVTGALDVFDELEQELNSSSVVSEPWDEEEDDYEDYEEAEEDETDVKQIVPAEADGDLGDSWKSYTVQVNNTVLTFPCSIGEVEATGLKLDTETTPEDYVINKDDYELVFFDDDNYNSLMFVVSNNTEEARTVRECNVSGLYVNDYDLEEGNITVIFPGDIQIGADIDLVIEKWGEPDDYYEGDYGDSYVWYDGDSLNCCVVSVDQETDKVTEIDLDGQELK